MSDVIAAGKVVSFHYTLTNDAGDVIDSSSGGEPLAYLHGAGNIIPGLENALAGHSSGDKLDVKVPPGEAYGEKQGPGPQPVPRQAFPDHVEVKVGMQFAVEGPGGQPVPVWVTALDDDTVHIDVNHPLAGETLNFAVTLVEVRDATQEEKDHGHPHGPGGANH